MIDKRLKNIFLSFMIIIFICLPVGAKDIVLDWDHDGECVSYKVYRGYSSNSWPELVGTVDCPVTEFTDTDVPNGDLYWIVTATSVDKEGIPSNEVFYAYYYQRTKYEYDSSSRILYMGQNPDIAALDGDTDWTITKYYYTNNIVTETRVRQGSWTDRTQGW